ncbi:MAG: 3-dehydroquinate synthase [Rhodospirillaceae bacterium TMED8]|nr:3-dehydroquinate synthase [Magnetovibrio sp.]OUT50792.1 MAG: 3-dehydroquinate synthase [Rhodospirillaceae bacterium TMED8]|tara:strand:- start:837 stop:1958 length:1122 start_codon:yes stop_codon:yes gene_type:complete
MKTLNQSKTLRVDLGERSYDIVIGKNLINRAGKYLRPHLSEPRVLTITDENVAAHWLEPYKASLVAENICGSEMVLPPGEKTKSFGQLKRVIEWVLQTGVDRKTVLVALGGGVIGDLVGFAAAIALRGIPLIQIPTTLLAQVDSSVGGKTAIDTPQGKNLVGAFYQPRLVLADLTTLDTLPLRQILAGYAEVIKYGLINNPDFFEWCETNGSDLINGDLGLRAHAVEKSCFIKAQVVARDEREAGLRALLNLGHTFGHAFEVEVGFGKKLLHGEAVAMGTIAAFEFSQRLGLCSGQDVVRIREHFRAVGLPIDISSVVTKKWTTDKLIHHMGKDKKVEANVLTFILARGIGSAFVSKNVKIQDLRIHLDNLLK